MVTESSTTEAMAMGLKLGGEGLVGKSLDNIVGSLWQARQESSGSSVGNQSPRHVEEDMMSEPEGSPMGTVRLKDTRDLMKEDRPDSGAFLGAFPGFDPSRFLATSQTPPPSLSSGNYGSNGSSNNNNNNNNSPGDSSQQNWSFEEQFKQLYEIDDNPKRKVFLDELFSLMQKRGTPINRLPIMAKQVLDLFELYNLVLARGGLVEVINKKLWQEVIKGLGLPSSITSAAFTLRTQYTKYLYPLECMQRNLSNPNELQMAIEGNKREGRRSSYGPYSAEALSRNGGFPSSISPPSNGPGAGGFPGAQDPLSALEMTRLALWKMYNSGGDFSRVPGHMNHHQHHENGSGSSSAAVAAAIKHSHKRPSEDREMSSSPKRPHTGGGGASSLSAPDVESPSSRLHPHAQEEEKSSNADSAAQARVGGGHHHNGSSEEQTSLPGEDRHEVDEEDEEEEEIEVRDSPRKQITHLNNLPGANIKIASRGDGKSKDSSLVVSMEINGISYQGVLFAQIPPPLSTTPPSSQKTHEEPSDDAATNESMSS
eukprot:TRINITY_DN995_c0_g1_i2.p1 TRINITY_DN995_c0_g1~~TRINITY_DN995_c0_g1_i2.p1  ORF type:complete len:540 (+),score=192.75 TRINITY_DN995_c0_g1_i2:142-1761(+)